MPNHSASAGAQQAHVAATVSQSLNASPTQQLAVTSNNGASISSDNHLACLAFLTAGTLLALASIAIAGLNGWARGASLPESVIWSGAGIALALVSLFGFSLALTCNGARRTSACVAWLLGLSFTIIAALGSQHGGRELATRTDGAITGERARLESAYKRASDELGTLPTARPAAVIDTELAGILKDPKLQDCQGWLENKRLRTICIEQVEPRRAEQSIARQRERLQTTMADATAALGKLTVGKPANADASAVQRYLAAVGLHIGAQRLADLLSLLTVVAMEVCGGVALALRRAQSIADAPKAPQQVTAESAAESGGGAGGVELPKSPAPTPSPEARSAESERRQRVIDRLLVGPIEGRQVDIARALGIPVTSMRRLAESDTRLRLTVGCEGSRLELV